MRTLPQLTSRPIRAALILELVLACHCAGAAPAAATAVDALHRQERATCISGRSNQDRATCLREADAAHAEARRGALQVGSPALTDNALRRCDPLPEAQRLACLARMQGQGSTSGSAATGGIFREISTPQNLSTLPR